MRCPDCGNSMKKLGTFYTCQTCGLSFKPWEVEDAMKRAKDEIKEIKGSNTPSDRRKRKEKRRYRDWLEGEHGID